MGPRLFSRGKSSGRTGPSGHGGSQARFNGAAAVQPRKEADSAAEARCLDASMGPRLFSRGKVYRC